MLHFCRITLGFLLHGRELKTKKYEQFGNALSVLGILACVYISTNCLIFFFYYLRI